MNIKKYIKKMAEYLDLDKRKCSDKKKCIKELLKALNVREKSLTKELSQEQDAERQSELQEEIKVLHKKREKGLKALKKLNKEGDAVPD